MSVNQESSWDSSLPGIGRTSRPFYAICRTVATLVSNSYSRPLLGRVGFDARKHLTWYGNAIATITSLPGQVASYHC